MITATEGRAPLDELLDRYITAARAGAVTLDVVEVIDDLLGLRSLQRYASLGGRQVMP